MQDCVLLRKSRCFGFMNENEITALINPAICDRIQWAEFCRVTSHYCSMSNGVVQGSNLGPLVFLIFYNGVFPNCLIMHLCTLTTYRYVR